MVSFLGDRGQVVLVLLERTRAAVLMSSLYLLRHVEMTLWGILRLKLQGLDDVRGRRRRGSPLLVSRLLQRQITLELGPVRRRTDRGVHPEWIVLTR